MEAIKRYLKSRERLFSIARRAHRLYAGIRNILRLRIRLVALESDPLDASHLAKVLADPSSHGIVEDLAAFTGLSLDQVRFRLLRFPAVHYKSEFRWHSPRDRGELVWYYRSNIGYLFANAVHPYWKILDDLDPSVGRTLDYGAGVGNNVMALARRGFEVDYCEINAMQEAFARFRVGRRHEIKNVSFIPPFVDGRFEPVKCITGRYGAIILQDVLEHIPDYHTVLAHLIDRLDAGGYILETSPFCEHAREIDIHLKPSIPLEEAMKGMRRIKEGVWRKG